jgi:hypothetical protein
MVKRPRVFLTSAPYLPNDGVEGGHWRGGIVPTSAGSVKARKSLPARGAAGPVLPVNSARLDRATSRLDTASNQANRLVLGPPAAERFALPRRQPAVESILVAAVQRQGGFKGFARDLPGRGFIGVGIGMGDERAIQEFEQMPGYAQRP